MEKINELTNEERRDKWIISKLESLPSGHRILDAGAGQMPYKKYCSHLKYVAQDASNYSPENSDDGLQMKNWEYGKLDIICDIISIPEPDASFDAILCSEVLEHLPDPLKALYEFKRLLRPEGRLIVTAPFCSMTHFAPHHYSTGFSKYYYEYHLKNLGFEIIEISPNGNYFDYIRQEINRIYYISEKYFAGNPNFIEKKALGVINRMLKRFSDSDRGSDELLNFGFHVLAKKIK